MLSSRSINNSKTHANINLDSNRLDPNALKRGVTFGNK